MDVEHGQEYGVQIVCVEGSPETTEVVVGITSKGGGIMREDEIQILGTSQKKNRKRILWWFVSLVVLLLTALAVIWGVTNANRRNAILNKVVADVTPLSILSSQESGLYTFDTEMNDISISTLHLVNMRTQLTQSVPEYEDSTMLLSVIATRKRAVGSDLVIDGKQISRGKPMSGFCAIVNGNVAIGESKDDDVMNYCIEHGGSFFRQNMLVRNGEVLEVALKGKAPRCALARQGNDMYVVYTLDEESVHDFAEAMVDIGVLDALLLDENLTTIYFRSEWDDIFCGPDAKSSSKDIINYLMFKKREGGK